jgi:hypothetical protein
MNLPAIELPVAIQLVTAIVTITGVYFTLKLGQAQLRKDFDEFKSENRAEIESLRKEVSGDQIESQRLLLALHKRFDEAEVRVGRVEINHAVLEERVKNLREDKISFRDTGRFRVARLEAERAGQVPMFEIIEGE